MFNVGDRVIDMTLDREDYMEEQCKATVVACNEGNDRIRVKWDDERLDDVRFWDVKDFKLIEEKKPDGWSSNYYKLPEGVIELQDLIEHREMNFAVGNIFKAAYRLGSKSGTDEAYDLRKIIWFAERELKRIEK